MKSFSFSLKMGMTFFVLIVLLVGIMSFIGRSLGSVSSAAARISDLRIPTAQASQDVLNGVGHSLAALRGWLLLKDTRYKEEREDVWAREIDFPLEKLTTLAVKWADSSNVERLFIIKTEVEKLRIVTADVERIAETLDNTPALKLFYESALPKIDIIYNAITEMIDIEAKLEANSKRKKLLKNMADFRGSIARSVFELETYLLSGDEQSKENYEKHWRVNSLSYSAITDGVGLMVSKQRELFSQVTQARNVFFGYPQEVFQLASGKQKNIANHWLATKALSSEKIIKQQLKLMVDSQKKLLEQDYRLHTQEINRLIDIMWGIYGVVVVVSIISGVYLTRLVTVPLKSAVETATNIGDGNLVDNIALGGSAEMVDLSNALSKMQDNISRRTQEVESQNWLKSNAAVAVGLTQGESNLVVMVESVVCFVSELLGAGYGVLYLLDKKYESTIAVRDENAEQVLSLIASYAFSERKKVSSAIEVGEGLVGQCAKEQKPILLTQVPNDYVKISSGLGEKAPLNIFVYPVMYENEMLGVLEMASFQPFSGLQKDLVEQVSRHLGVACQNLYSKKKTESLLKASQIQSEELKTQQEELSISNENLESQARQLQQSEEELRVSNEELEEKQKALSMQKDQLEIAKRDLEIKADDLAQASRYKTEFLANMSHELRTPLNSLLILSKMLSANKEGNLTEKQLEDVKIIVEGGNDLLRLINDIMDLSKVEAGMLLVHDEEIYLADIFDNVKKTFNAVALDKGVEFNFDVGDAAPETILTDGQRVEQVLNNFLSNAFKFTAKGSVTLKCYLPQSRESVLLSEPSVAISVIDTGIGIAESKQQAIFEVFKQADGSTSRKYGGTGLGLAISKELAHLLHGEIDLSSREGEGSCFTLYLPREKGQGRPFAQSAEGLSAERQSTERQSTKGQSTKIQSENLTAEAMDNQERPQVLKSMDPFINDDRRAIQKNDRSLLLIEDDPVFAKILMGIAHRNHFKCLAANKGRDGLYLALEYQPSGIMLDVGLPDINGLKVLEQLKYNLKTRHIPVHIISGADHRQASLAQGANGFMAKPATEQEIEDVFSDISRRKWEKIKTVLVVDDEQCNQVAIERLIESENVQCEFASTGEQACEMCQSNHYDCVILDLGLPDIRGEEVLSRITNFPGRAPPPVIIYTGQEISAEQQRILSEFTSDIIIKGAESPERLLDDVSLFLHSVAGNLSDEQQAKINMLHDEDAMLQGRRVLVVDDDMRNVFALTRHLESSGLEVDMAENGQVAINLMEAEADKQDNHSPIELILMDIMMPVVDGYEATRRIRKMTHCENIPIITLTAKAMPEDYVKSMDAGASEYLTKPVDLDKLLSMLRIWLYRK
jgi:signal transduction histidine kinase/CheY-like chemotaxis protein